LPNRPLVFPRYLPVPVNLEVCGLLAALSLTLSVPVRVPVSVGLNTTLMVHLPLEHRGQTGRFAGFSRNGTRPW